MLIRSAVLAAALAALPAAADDVFVPLGSSIQDAIQGSGFFDTILIEPGVYEESLFIDAYRGLTLRPATPSGRVELRPEGGDGTIIRINGNYDAGTTLERFDLVGADDGAHAVEIGGNADPTLFDCTLSGLGGGVRIIGGGLDAGLTAIRCTFSGLSAPGGRGGAVVADRRARISLFSCVFEDNTASDAGGALSFRAHDQEILILDCRFARNLAGRGGAIHHDASPGSQPHVGAHIVNAEFVGNSTNLGTLVGNGDGGAILWAGRPVTISGCTFEGNTCHPSGSSTGGAVSFAATSDSAPVGSFVDRCVFVANRAAVGGAVGTPFRAMMVSNSLFVANTGESFGAAIAAGDDTAFGTTVAHCTFVANESDEGGGGSTVQLNGGRAALTGCLFAASGPLPIDAADLLPAYNLFDNRNAAAAYGPTNTYAADLGFTGYDPSAPIGGDYRPAPGSPAIDFVPPALLPDGLPDQDRDFITFEPLPLDLDGAPRFSALAPDAGAHEFPDGPPACPADLTGDGTLNADDLDAFAALFLAGDGAADVNADGTLNFDDIDAFVASFLAGCP